MANPIVNMARAQVKSPDGTVYQAARFVRLNDRAAVWVEDKSTRTATRVLFATGVTFNKPPSAKLPMTVTTSDSEVWEIRQIRGGCGCSSPLKNIPIRTLLDPDTTTL